MTALAEWTRILYPAREKLLRALRSPEVHHAIATVLDPKPGSEMIGPELSHDEERDLDTALRVLDEAGTG